MVQLKLPNYKPSKGSGEIHGFEKIHMDSPRIGNRKTWSPSSLSYSYYYGFEVAGTCEIIQNDI